jgi:predicted metal-binding protein
MSLTAEAKTALDEVIQANGYTDYKWIDPDKIITAQWVRMKCMFGCNGYGNCAACPPNTPSLAECERFFSEYEDAILLHFEGTMDRPENRHNWSKKINAKLVKLEREVFLSGYERAFSFFMDSCCFCKECSATRETCQEPMMARPSPEGMGVDVYATVRQFGFSINVRTDYDQQMDRYAFLMIR